MFHSGLIRCVPIRSSSIPSVGLNMNLWGVKKGTYFAVAVLCAKRAVGLFDFVDWRICKTKWASILDVILNGFLITVNETKTELTVPQLQQLNRCTRSQDWPSKVFQRSSGTCAAWFEVKVFRSFSDLFVHLPHSYSWKSGVDVLMYVHSLAVMSSHVTSGHLDKPECCASSIAFDSATVYQVRTSISA